MLPTDYTGYTGCLDITTSVPGNALSRNDTRHQMAANAPPSGWREGFLDLKFERHVVKYFVQSAGIEQEKFHVPFFHAIHLQPIYL
jgi:hypothetical protein